MPLISGVHLINREMLGLFPWVTGLAGNYPVSIEYILIKAVDIVALFGEQLGYIQSMVLTFRWVQFP